MTLRETIGCAVFGHAWHTPTEVWEFAAWKCARCGETTDDPTDVFAPERISSDGCQE